MRIVPGQPFTDEDVAHVLAVSVDHNQVPAIPAFAADRADLDTGCVQDLDEAPRRCLTKFNLAGAAANAGRRFRGVIAMRPQLHAIDPQRVAINNAGVPLSAPALTYRECGTSYQRDDRGGKNELHDVVPLVCGPRFLARRKASITLRLYSEAA